MLANFHDVEAVGSEAPHHDMLRVLSTVVLSVDRVGRLELLLLQPLLRDY